MKNAGIVPRSLSTRQAGDGLCIIDLRGRMNTSNGSPIYVMSTFSRVLATVVGVTALTFPASSALALSVTVQSLSPGSTVQAKHALTFSIATDFNATLFTIADAFSNSSITPSLVNAGGNFSWVPVTSDVGTHTLTITARNVATADSATATQTITVTAPPSLSVSSLFPGDSVMPNSPLSFTVIPVGVTNPRYSVHDSFDNTTLTNAAISATGIFSWTPDSTQNGTHAITVYATDASGQDVSTVVNVRVGAGPSLAITPATSTIYISPLGYANFIVAPVNFIPTGFSVTDSFAGSTAGNANIATNGTFTWTPTPADVGVHIITIRGVVGTYGQSASITQKIVVIGADGKIPVDAQAPVVVATTTAPAAGSTLTTLITQLAVLQSKLAAQKNAATTPATTTDTTPAKFVFTHLLILGSHGTEVLKLQQRLVELGFMTAKPNGNFGAATKAAVKKFQIANGIDPKGHVGPATRDALNR